MCMHATVHSCGTTHHTVQYSTVWIIFSIIVQTINIVASYMDTGHHEPLYQFETSATLH